MNNSIASLINPQTRNANDLAFTVKQWTNYMNGEPFNLLDEDARKLAHNSLCRWTMITGERVKIGSVEDAAYELIDVNLNDPDDFLSVFAEENEAALHMHGFAYPVFRINTEFTGTVSKPDVTSDTPERKKRVKVVKTQKDTEVEDIPENLRFVSKGKNVQKGHKKTNTGTKDTHTWKTKKVVGPMLVDFTVENYEEYMVCYDKNGQEEPMMYHVDPAGEFNGMSPCACDSDNPANPYNVACRHNYMDLKGLDKCGLCMLKRFKSKVKRQS